MVKKKLCPLKSYKADYSYECVEQKCGWWNEGFGMCAVAAIAKTLTLPVLAKEMREY